jgi:hypothetical protein
MIRQADEMRNNVVRDPAGVASDTRRIKNNRAVIALGFGLCGAGVSVGSLPVDLPSGYLRPHEQTGVVPSDI